MQLLVTSSSRGWHGAMTPNATGGVLLYLPGAVVDFPTSPAVLDLKVGRGIQIERDHMVVGVTSQAAHNVDALFLAQIERCADVVD